MKSNKTLGPYLYDVQNGSQNTYLLAETYTKIFITARQFHFEIDRIEYFNSNRYDHNHWNNYKEKKCTVNFIVPTFFSFMLTNQNKLRAL